jgi:hypothetical protein
LEAADLGSKSRSHGRIRGIGARDLTCVREKRKVQSFYAMW